MQHRNLLDDVDLAALQRQDFRLVVGKESNLDPIRKRCLAPVVRVAHERGADFRRVFFELEGAGADHRGFEILRILRRNDDRVVVVGRHCIGEIAVGHIEVERHGVVIDLAGAALRQHSGEHRERVRAICGIGEPVEGRHHVIRRHRFAIVEFDSLAQLEGPHRAVLVRSPAFCQHRNGGQIGARQHQSFAELRQYRQAAAIGNLDRIDRGGRNDLAEADGTASRSPRWRSSGDTISHSGCDRSEEWRG